jgi:hypothetical protein
MKIKTFTFYVTDGYTYDIDFLKDAEDKERGISFRTTRCKYTISTKEDIDKEINKWLATNPNIKIQNILIQNVTIKQHNNGKCDTNELFYTILYEE